MTARPGVQLARRPLHFILLADCSGSMAASGKIGALNTAVREVLPHLAETSYGNPHAEVTVRAIGFSTGARWHVEEPTAPDELDWADLKPGGYTDLGAALDLVGSVLTVPPMQERALAPALVLVSDGMPTDDFNDAMDRLLEVPWGARAIRMAVAIGQDADYDTLHRFIGEEGVDPITASNPEQLMLALRWATVHVARAASSMSPLVTPDTPVRPWAAEADESTVW